MLLIHPLIGLVLLDWDSGGLEAYARVLPLRRPSEGVFIKPPSLIEQHTFPPMPDRTKALPRPFKLSQNIIDGQEPEISRPIPTQTIQEANLVKSDLFQIFDHALPLGLSPGFSETGQLVALAIADAKECRIIEFALPLVDKKTKAKKPLPPDILANRETLQETILCRSAGDLLAFDMGPLVMAIHKYLHLSVMNAIDIQSSFSVIDRKPISAIEEALGDSVKINRKNVRSVFLYPVYSEDDANRLSDLAMRAWISQFLATFKDGMMLFENAKRIDTKKLKDPVSHSFLSWIPPIQSSSRS